jgi:hypothetical protein
MIVYIISYYRSWLCKEIYLLGKIRATSWLRTKITTSLRPHPHGRPANWGGSELWNSKVLMALFLGHSVAWQERRIADCSARSTSMPCCPKFCLHWLLHHDVLQLHQEVKSNNIFSKALRRQIYAKSHSRVKCFLNKRGHF